MSKRPPAASAPMASVWPAALRRSAATRGSNSSTKAPGRLSRLAPVSPASLASLRPRRPSARRKSMRRRSPTAIGPRARASVRLVSIAVGLPTGSPAAAVTEPLRL